MTFHVQHSRTGAVLCSRFSLRRDAARYALAYARLWGAPAIVVRADGKPRLAVDARGVMVAL